jgi:hypothetical protein
MVAFVVKEELLAVAAWRRCENDCPVISGSPVGPQPPCNLLLIMFYMLRLSGLMLS